MFLLNSMASKHMSYGIEDVGDAMPNRDYLKI